MDFQTVDSLIQVHDYLGLGLSSRDANSKKAAAEATQLFQDHYPELLVRLFFPSFLSPCANTPVASLVNVSI